MGTTIRREPVNFDIPASPNYKFLNITNFRGLDVSSNPFELATNTASDCLNVYVDETNTLTTRPRLEKKSFKDGNDNEILPLVGSHISTYNLHNGYLLHYLQDNRAVMIKFIDNSKIDVSGDIPTNVCQYFEQGDKIYLLADNRYMVIDENNILSDVIGYIPTTAVVDLNGVRHDVENLNLLNLKYKETYYWNGLQPLDIKDPEMLYKEDLNYSNKEHLYNSETASLKGYKIFMFYDDYSFIAQGPEKAWLGGDVSYFTTDNRLNTVNQPIATGALNTTIKTCASKAKTFWTHESETVDNETSTYLCNYYLDTTGIWKKSSTRVETTGFKNIFCISSPNGNYLYLTYNDTNDVRKHCFFKRNLTNNTFLRKDIDASKISSNTYSSSLIHDGNVYVLDTEDCKVVLKTVDNICFASYDTGKFENLFSESDINIGGWGWLKTTIDGSLLYVRSSTTGKHICIKNFDESTKFFIEDAPSNYFIADDLSYGYYYSENATGDYNLYVTNDYTQPLSAVKMDLQLSENIIYKYSSARTSHYVKIDLKNIIFTQSSNGLFYYGDGHYEDLYVWNPDGEPHIDVYKEISKGTTRYEEWIEKRERLLKSKLYTRFDNNYWFSSGNRYYRSANNDPTYFPITEYNDLGDSNEDITGFNLANDTTLIAYKKNRIFLIQPFVSSQDTTEYTITESKNTVGNTAIGAPIVTTLTEIPLQINNDGIYGLSQLSNVSATERIADLMSEPINERWLNIDDELITKAQTLNRLYWTYVIIPNNENNKTMIYLLDNRSNSWYYWELPIVVVNSFVKNNRTEFVDKNGLIYYLTTTDIKNKSFDTQLVTEYYDDDHKLISWYWQSQVLPLGTMNYSKRLVNTTFILTDTDTQDGYGLNYNFKVFRKLASNTPEKEISGDLNLVRSTTKKTNISKFGFIQLKISNITEESQGTEPEKAYRNNKLRLVGLGLKYVLLEGLIR